MASALSAARQQSEFDVDQDCPVESDELKSSFAEAAHRKLVCDDEDDETLESVLGNLPEDLTPLRDSMYKAQGCCLLLILKQFLKEIYTISDSKIQNYSPTDTAKVNDRPITSRKTNRRFNPKPIIEYMHTYEAKREPDESLREALAREYLEFKELMLSIDQDEGKADDAKSGVKTGASSADAVKLTALQQKLFEGIEKTKVSLFDLSGIH